MGKKFLGIRTSPSEVRYAILENSADRGVIFVNATSENKLQYPASLTTTPEKLRWLKGEMDRIFRQVPDIEQTILKTNEYTGTETKSKRESSYADAVCILAAYEHQIPVVCKLYTQIGSTSQESMGHAESRVGRIDKYWNKQIADAILAAHSAMR